MSKEKSFLEFVKQERKKDARTDTYLIYSKMSVSHVLGKISWYGPWRRYIFESMPNCIFDAACLQEITSFIENLMLERKLAKQNITQNTK